LAEIIIIAGATTTQAQPQQGHIHLQPTQIHRAAAAVPDLLPVAAEAAAEQVAQPGEAIKLLP